MMDIIEQLFYAAVIEARTVPKMMWRDGERRWRAAGGIMVRLTGREPYEAR